VRSVVSVVLLTAAVALALPVGPLASASPASALMVTQPALRIGSGGPVVVQLQHWLTTLHYDVGPIDGSFDVSTGKASTPTPVGNFSISRRVNA
jgi:peptidoglycan hydrolase-like protein with peptidoglycan-binding domain